MRIAMFTNNYKPFLGGVPISIERLAEGLRELGHTVYIFAPTYENQEEEEFVIRYKSYKKVLVDQKMVMPNILDDTIEKSFVSLNFNIIHVHHPMLMGKVALRLGKKYNIPVTFTYHTRYEFYLHNVKAFNIIEEQSKIEHNGYLSELEEKFLSYTKDSFVPNYVRKFTNKCDKVFAPTKLIKDYLENIGSKAEIQIMPTGLDKSYFNENAGRSEEIRARFKENKKFLFCTVSRLTKEKNIEFIIEGIAELKNRVGNVFNLIIIGEGPLKEELEKLTRSFGVEENIKFLNSVSNKFIGDYYRASDMFLFSSKSETQGIVLLEAMAAKNPVVAIEATGVADVVENGINGYMTVESINEWVDKIIHIMNDSDEMQKLKLGAFNTALKYLNSNIAKIAEKNYKEVIDRHNGTSYRINEEQKYIASTR